MKQLLFILVCSVALSGLAQDLKQEITAMNAHLEQLTDYRITVDYSAGDTTDFFDQGEASVLVSNSGFFYQTEFASMIINGEHTIIVNEDERALIYSDNQDTPKKSPSLNDYVLQGMDTLVEQADSIYFSTNGNQRIYHLRFKNGYFNLVECTFEGAYLSKVVYFYNEAIVEEQGLTATCTVHIEEEPVYDKAMLTSDFYLTHKNGAVVPSEHFTGYILIYNESIESFTE